MPSYEEIGDRLRANPGLFLRMTIGHYMIGPVYVLLKRLVHWFMGQRPLCVFGILYNPELGYCVKVGESEVQWYDDIEQAATALGYHVNVYCETAPYDRSTHPSVNRSQQ